MYEGDGQSAEAERAMASGAVEMGVEFFYFARAFVGAYGIFEGAGSVVDAVYKMVG